MANGSSRDARVSRESRLLLLTVGVCAVVLLVLARLRFPEAPVSVDPSTPPLERLAARASYDALAADIQQVEPLIAESLVVLRVASQPSPAPLAVAEVLVRPEETGAVTHVAALRISTNVAVAFLDGEARIDGIVGAATGTGDAGVLAADPIRRIGRIRVPDAAVRQVSQVALASLQVPVYVVAVEGTQAGVTLRPLFLGRGDRFASPRWSRPLLPLGGNAVTPGALIFSLAGEFIGAVVLEDRAPAIVGARDVLDTVTRLASPSNEWPADLGISVQALTPALRAALAVERGVVVSEVDPGGASAAVLEPGDVITAIDDWATDDPTHFLLRVASRQAGESVGLAVLRLGQPRTLAVPLARAGPGLRPEASTIFSLERGVGTRVEKAGGVSASGLQTGDVITRAGGTAAPTPAQVRRVLSTANTSGFTTMLVRRDDRQRVVAVPVAEQSDAATR